VTTTSPDTTPIVGFVSAKLIPCAGASAMAMAMAVPTQLTGQPGHGWRSIVCKDTSNTCGALLSFYDDPGIASQN